MQTKCIKKTQKGVSGLKNAARVFVILLLTIFTMACSQETSNLSENSANVKLQDDNSSGFVKEQIFKGGEEAKDYTLLGIRKRPNPSLTRIQLNFGIDADATLPGEPPVLVDKPPLYKVSYQDSDRKITAIVKGVMWDVSEDKIQELKDRTPIIKEINYEAKDGDLYVIFTLKEPISFKVFDRSEPASITIEMKPDGDISS